MSFFRRLPMGFLICSATLLSVTLFYAFQGDQIHSPGALHAGSDPPRECGGVTSHAMLKNNCEACHAPAWSSERMENRCLACHQAVQKQLHEHVSLHGKQKNGSECLHCHTEHLGTAGELTDFTKFEHQYTAFPLTGGHVGLHCAKCHHTTQYQIASKSCVSCHAEPKFHLGKFGQKCEQCHTTATWKASQLHLGQYENFDHDRTKFPLTGAHRSVGCMKCHTNGQFVGTAMSCVACHTEPVKHLGKFGTDCQSCHSTSTWRGATIANHKFPMNHGGGKRNKDCTICHQSPDYRQYTCYGCHKHEPEKTAQKHRKVDLTIIQLESCATCHPTGREAKNKRPK